MKEIDLERLVLSDVANTGLLTACCHASESRSADPILRDPMIEAIVDRLVPVLARSPRKIHRQWARGRFRKSLVVYFAVRARKYDQYARGFMARHPGGGIVNLGCGLDTRFWRLDDGRLHFYDLDLPEMIDLKRELVTETDRYHLIGRSVLDRRWMDEVGADQPGPFLILAEGLFMYLPPDDVRELVVELCSRFPGGELVFETVNSTWLQPHLKWMIAIKMHQQLGLGRDLEYLFGLRDGREVESWTPAIHLLEEWSYLDEDEPKLGPVRWMRHWQLYRKTQWTVRYALGKEDASAPV